MGDPERLQIIRSLGADRATFVARDTSSGAARLVVVERVTRTAPKAGGREELLRRAHALAALEHPKVVRVRDVVERAGEVLVVSDYVDGEWLSTLMKLEPRVPLEVMLRIVLDVLEGLGALHDLQDDHGQPLRFAHGALSPDAVLVADDGVAEIAHACHAARRTSNERYVPPELRRGDGVADTRSDIYAVGAILRDVLADAPADAKWAEPLTEIAWRACSVDAENRWPSAATMATTVRRIAGSRLASASTVAAFVRAHFGHAMRARRAALDTLEEPAPPSSGEPISIRPGEMEVVQEAPFPSVVATMPPPVPVKAQVARVGLVKVPAEMADRGVLEPETTRRPQGTVTQRGMMAMAPPPTGVPPDAVSEQDMPTEAYRRQLPTFPTLDESPPPPRRSSALQGIVIALGMVLTFLTGWWVGRTYAPMNDARQTNCPPAATTEAMAAPKPPPPLPVPVATATASATASATPSASATATPTATPSATATPTVPAWALAPPRPTATVAPTATVTPTATATATATTKPTASGGYVPSEL
jgi:hypothetical protein